MASSDSSYRYDAPSEGHTYAASRYAVSSSEDTPQYTPTSSSGYPTTTADGPAYTTVTSQNLQRHDTNQGYLHRDAAHVTHAQQNHRRRMRRAAQSIDAALPDYIHGRGGYNQVGMTPMARFEAADAESPHQRAVSYQPSNDNVSYYQAPTTQYQDQYKHQHLNAASASPSQQSSSAAYSYVSQGATYYASDYPQYQTPPPGKDLTDWGYDLAGVGTQFGDSDAARGVYRPNGTYDDGNEYVRR